MHLLVISLAVSEEVRLSVVLTGATVLVEVEVGARRQVANLLVAVFPVRGTHQAITAYDSAKVPLPAAAAGGQFRHKGCVPASRAMVLRFEKDARQAVQMWS